MKLPLLIKEQDKANHFIVGSIIYCVLACFTLCYISMAAVIAVALLKEWTDSKFDLKDVIYTVLGAVPPFILSIVQF